MKKLETATLALLLGATIDWEALGLAIQTEIEKQDTPVEETEKETPVEETEKEENSVEETEKEEEDPEDLAIETWHYLICKKTGGPFEYDKLYNMVVINNRQYAVCGQKAYRVYKSNNNGCLQRFETKDGAQFM